MRMLMKVSMPVGKGNEAAKSGALQRTLHATMERIKAEAAYFYPEEGRRTAVMIFDMKASWDLPEILEPLFQELGASVDVTPCMNADDLRHGLKDAGLKSDI